MNTRIKFKRKLEEVYPFQLVWLDWGLLKDILALSSNDSSKYDLDLARERLKKTEGVLINKFGYKAPKLVLGYQLLEADKQERKDFMVKLWNELGYPIIEMSAKVGHQYCYVAYTLLEIGDYLLNYAQNTEIRNDIYLKFRQRVLSDGGYDKLNFGNLPELFEQTAKELGTGLLDTIAYFRKEYDQKDYGDVYIAEKAAFTGFFKEILIKYPRLFSYLGELAGIPNQKFPHFINKFLSSEYFESLELPIIWANTFSSWMVKDKERKLTTSERGDLMELLEIGLFADVGFVDKRTHNTWNKRYKKDFNMKLFKSGELLTELSKKNESIINRKASRSIQSGPSSNSDF